ncbi:unannotated protein [freshwater metagenome]|uniref:Unannotated protein n=1 Tax=freshwater metagenome TaxID=449393 RepID=A0A6J6NWY4_9ZZZZ
MQLIRGLERGDGSARAGVCEQQRLQDLVGAVGHEHLARIDIVQGGNGGAKFGGRAVGIAMPLDA